MNWNRRKPKQEGPPPWTKDIPFDQFLDFCDEVERTGRFIFSAERRRGFYRVVVQEKPCATSGEGVKQLP